MHADKECCIMHIGWIFVLCFIFPRYSVATSKCHDLNAPAQNTGKALIAGPAPAAWQNTPVLTGVNNHAVAKTLEHVIQANAGNKFIAYNNIPPDIPKVKTKSNSKGVLMMNPGVPDEASWIVHTIPGFPKALRGYVFPPAEIQKGHLFICLTIKESEIDAIAMALRIATPLIYHNDIPDDPARPNLKKLVNGESRLTPPLTLTRQISTAAAPGLKVTIYSKGEKSKYEIYRRVLVKKLKTSIKVWTTRDKTLKSDCRILGRNIKLVASPIDVNGHASSLDSDVSQWLISDPGNKFCAIDKPYHKSQTKEPAMAVCIDDATIFGHFSLIGQNNSILDMKVVVYKAPAQNMGKALIAGRAPVVWQNTPDLTQPNNHAVVKSLEHVIAVNPTNKFIAYNNIPPDIPKVKTKSNSKGVLMMNPGVPDEASWIVHTIPGFPKALRGYVFPPAEIQKGHLFICLTIKESEIDAIAMALRIATPLIYHNDIPDDPARPNLKKLVNGESRLTPPLTVTQQISTAAAQGLKMTIYSKSEKSKYEIYRRVLVKKLKTSIRAWTTRDKTLKSDCRILNRNIKLVASPIDVNGHASSLDSDVSQWLISDPGNKFCAIDKPYHKSQTKEPAMAVCIDDATIFGHFNLIGQNKSQTKEPAMAFELEDSLVVDCMAMMYKAPAQNTGKALIAGAAGAWQDTAAVTGPNGHSFAKALEHVIASDNTNKFIAYNNIPPDIPKVKTKSNSKGVLMMNPNAADDASWIVHTVPGFPKALRGYVFPPAEIQKGHLFICLTIKGSEIDAIDAQINSRPDLKKLVNGESRLTPPLTVTRQISTAAAAGLKVTIYKIYRKVLVKKLKTSIKVWTTRDKILKTDCRILNRNIKLVTSPITIGGHASSLESDVSQWLISEPGNKFCVIDKPYHKSQTKEPAMAVCIDDATIFGHFNKIAHEATHDDGTHFIKDCIDHFAHALSIANKEEICVI
ncbi:Plancitoxin-1 [Trichinella spiralis]|uniref:Plancitoxin-1 n=1 Tax=Trichinella spiralis TaxID=6334 RepID=A0A0V1BI39_TRISP|nr:Plancitoxin-1 [Trichinella spiralis]